MYRRRYASIPNDWKVKKIKDISEQVFAGGTPSTRKPEYWDGDIPWMSSGEINKKFIFNTDRRITKEGYESSSTKMVPKNSVLIALAGQGKTRGTVGMNKIELCTNQSIASIVPPDTVDSKFLYYNLDSRYDELRRLSTGDGGRGGLNLQIIKNIFVALPSLEEQRKITSILSTWDKAIELKEKLIEQKKEQKKGLMQKLLTGEIRLPGFEGVWKKVRLGNIGKTYNGLSGKSAEDFGEGKPYIPYKTIFDDSKIDINKLDYVRIEENEKQNKAKYGDIFFTTSSETPDEVGMSSVLLDHIDEVYLNSFCFGYRLNDFNVLHPEFAQYLFRSNGFRKKTLSLAQGSTRFNISKNEVMKIEVLLPSIEEQKLIASILTNSDREIKLLQKQVELIKEQKKGLMQLLLTGKVRVKV
jgi:type I restriction enzyme, S subunit